MAVSDGQRVNAAVTNAAFMSRLVDTSTVGKVDLSNVGSDSISDVQNVINNVIQNQKIFVKTSDNSKVTWDSTAGELSFTADLEIYDPVYGYVTTILQSNSPISISNSQHAYVTLDRASNSNATPIVSATIPNDEDVFRLFTRLSNALFWFDNSNQLDGQAIRIGEVSSNTVVSQESIGSGDGVTVNFNLSFTPISDEALLLFVNSVPQILGTDHTLSGVTVTFATAPSAGQNIYAYYTRRES